MTEKNELLLFKGNDTSIETAADRIRSRGAYIVFDTYPITTTTRTDENIRMTILSNGNVGIGTTTPNFLLDVNGNIQCNTLTAENLMVGSTNVITEINTKQNIINDNDLTIPKILNLQSSFVFFQIDAFDTHTFRVPLQCLQDFLRYSFVITLLGGLIVKVIFRSGKVVFR